MISSLTTNNSHLPGGRAPKGNSYCLTRTSGCFFMFFPSPHPIIETNHKNRQASSWHHHIVYLLNYQPFGKGFTDYCGKNKPFSFPLFRHHLHPGDLINGYPKLPYLKGVISYLFQTIMCFVIRHRKIPAFSRVVTSEAHDFFQPFFKPMPFFVRIPCLKSWIFAMLLEEIQ